MEWSRSMRRAQLRLGARLTGRWAKEKFAWLCQKYNVLPWDECPAAMQKEIETC